MDTLLIVLLVLVLFGVVGGPWWGYHHLGYYPSGLFWTVAAVCLVVYVVRRTR